MGTAANPTDPANPGTPPDPTNPSGPTSHPLAVLLAEHDPEVAEMARRYLTRAGVQVTVTTEADETTAALAARAARVAVLDLTMPGLDPRRLRRLLTPPRRQSAPLQANSSLQPQKSHQPLQPLQPRLPALFLLSAAMRPRDLRVAAESCLWRPFSPRLLVARVLAIAPRPAPAGHIRAAVPGPARGVALTPAELALLTALAEHPGRVLTRDRLQDVLTRLPRSDGARPAVGRAVDVHVSQLRAKLPDPALIRTVRGVGYVLDDPDPGAAQSGGG
jgi:DNA-binding response OmpR family regulator